MGAAQVSAEVTSGIAEMEPRWHRLLTDWRVHTWAIMVAALVPRLLYLAQIHHWPFFYHPILDSRTQNSWAEILVRSMGIGNNEVLAKPPLYAYFLALTKATVGTGEASLFAARLLQLALGAVTCGLTYLVGRRTVGAAAGGLGALLLACYSPGIFDEGELLDTALATFLATAFLLALLASLDKPTTARWLGTGMLLGLLGLTRGNLLLLAPLALALLWAWLRTGPAREQRRSLALVFVVGVVLPILPITARNALITGGLIPISNNGGINFYTGNSPEADGYSPIPSGMAWERTWYEQMKAGALTYRDQDRYWLGKGLAFWRREPGKALALLAKKAYLYWGAYEIPNNLSYDWGRAHASLLRAMPLTFPVLGPLALLGLALGGGRSRLTWLLTLFVAGQMVAVSLFFVCGRYRMPTLPALCLFAGFVPVALVRLGRSGRWSAIGLALVGLVAFAALVNADLYRVGRLRGANRDWVYLGQSYAEQQRFSEARGAFEQAVQVAPQDADAWSFLANMARQSGDVPAAARAFRRALQLAPDFATAASSLANLSVDNGLPLEEAERLLERALQDQPTNVAGLAALVRINVRLGQKEQAQENLKRTAQAFSKWNKGDSRYAFTQAVVQQAAAEVMAAGIAVPPALGAPPPSSGMGALH